ncbi:MAG: radical SAM protein, partial [Pseudomonadota bacterium]
GDDPPFLAWVDRQYMRELGLLPSPLWDAADESVGLLTAPTEVHFAITNRCDAGCPHCYMDAGAPEEGELSTRGFMEVLDVLAGMGVFHVALGGGEALLRPDLFEIAQYARDIGLVPNLTTSGYGLSPELAERMRIFGQVNVSMDGVGDLYGVFRGVDRFPEADRALGFLVDAGVPAGINCVVGRDNFPGLSDLFAYVRDRGGNEIEFLRYKPAGRGQGRYRELCTTPRQNERIVPDLARLSGDRGVAAKIDCSFVPMLCFHGPPPEALEAMATVGCEAGNVLLGVRANGAVCGCSFLPASGIQARDLASAFPDKSRFHDLPSWHERAPEPCRSCEYVVLCKGGCHAVTLHENGDIMAPDPGCPRVREALGSSG